MEASLAVN